ncbi:hypothetical protein SFC76_00045 [Sphingomonas sp. CD22]|uniref:hypothetical protein n=1 Tax=Sphingomonas sp. CD22 TaxID=3100214 RepID=UPI002AE02A4E|nr:hypothetical protein [Sphingomonas sp. CD22]MEA1082636.1 hypothetical protein [Sphingomonas sp. CD22]
MRRSRVTAWIAPAGGALAGLATAALFLLVPQAVLEDWVWQSGLPALIAVAAPPLGDTARAVLALAGGGLAAAVTWSALFLLFGAGGLFAPRPATDAGVPVLRRADAHPDAPARRPMSAADLGTPLPPPTPPVIETVPSPQSVAPIDDNEGEREGEEALPDERAIPADLDLPLAAFHPDALPEVPREPVRPVLPLRPPALAAAEPTPVPSESPQPVAPPAPAGPSEVPSIESLLDRLERSTRWKARA